MREDPYILNRQSNEKFSEKDNENYHCGWSRFLRLVTSITENKEKMPGKKNMKHLLDVNCWLLLFHGYSKKRDTRFAHTIIDELENTTDVDENLFKNNVKTLYTIFHFNLKSFYEVWEYQHNIKRLLHQIVREQFFIGNRFASAKKRRWKPPYQLICSPTIYDNIGTPKLHQILDGLIFPVLVSKNNGNYKAERLELTNFGEGDFITCNGEVIDCIRINNFWQTRNHLKQRLTFSFLVETDYDEAPMIVCNNMKDIEEAWRMLGANPKDGVLIRSLGENLYENYWLLLNKESAFVGAYTQSGYTLNPRVSNKRGFITLEGRHVGNLGYTHTALKKMRWIDEFDLERFRGIVFQTHDYSIPDDVLSSNNLKDMRPEFDYGLFDADELIRFNDDYSWDEEDEKDEED